MQKILCFFESDHFIDAFIGAMVAILINGLYNLLIKKICYWKIWGNYYHGNKTDQNPKGENKVVIRHSYGDFFSITEYKNDKIQWKGAYQRLAKNLLTGTYDYNYDKEAKIADWGTHYLRLLPNEKTMSVLIKPLVPKKDELSI